MENKELQHHGIPGMKWGIRRYQNKDGSLTAAGKKRYEKELAKLKEEQRILNNKKKTQAKLDKLAAMRKSLDETKAELGETSKIENVKEKVKELKADKPSKRKIKSMSDEEIQARINRLDLEKKYADLISKPKEQKQVNKGESFASKLIQDAIIPAAIGSGKKALGVVFDKLANKVLGLDKQPEKSEAEKFKDKLSALKDKKDYAELTDFFKKRNNPESARYDELKLRRNIAEIEDFFADRKKKQKDD